MAPFNSTRRWSTAIFVAIALAAVVIVLTDIVVVGRVLEPGSPQELEIQQETELGVPGDPQDDAFSVVELRPEWDFGLFRVPVWNFVKDQLPGKVGGACLGTFIHDGSVLVTAGHCLDPTKSIMDINLPDGGVLKMRCVKPEYWNSLSRRNHDCSKAKAPDGTTYGDWGVCRAVETPSPGFPKPIQLATQLEQADNPVFLLKQHGVSKPAIGAIASPQGGDKCFGLPAGSSEASGTGLVLETTAGWKLLAVYSGGNSERLFSSVLHRDFETLLDG